MTYGATAMFGASAIGQVEDYGYKGEEARISEGTLASIRGRIDRAATMAQEIGYKLSEHADRVHGPTPQAEGNGKDQAAPLSLLGEIFTALDRLDAAQSYMAEQAGRNCTLA